MKYQCRLCAKYRTKKQLKCSIDDQHLNIKQKLIDCCRWNSFISHETMPQMICNTCFKTLETCWAFAETIEKAQQLLSIQLTNIHEYEPPNQIFMKVEPLELDVELDDYSLHEFKNHELSNFQNNIRSPSIIEEINCNYFKDSIEQPTFNISDQLHTETKQLTYLCETCGKDFTSKSNLVSHIKLHLPLNERRHFECYLCRTIFSYKKSLMTHMPIHSGENNRIQCKICFAHFSRTDALRRHSLIHQGKFMHECSTCGKKFRTKSNLKVKC